MSDIYDENFVFTTLLKVNHVTLEVNLYEAIRNSFIHGEFIIRLIKNNRPIKNINLPAQLCLNTDFEDVAETILNSLLNYPLIDLNNFDNEEFDDKISLIRDFQFERSSFISDIMENDTVNSLYIINN